MMQFLFKCKFPSLSFPGWDASSSHDHLPPPPPSLPNDTHLYTWVKDKERPKRSKGSCLRKQWGDKA